MHKIDYTKAGMKTVTIAYNDDDTAVITSGKQVVECSKNDAKAIGFKLERMGCQRSDSEAAILFSVLTGN